MKTEPESADERLELLRERPWNSMSIDDRILLLSARRKELDEEIRAAQEECARSVAKTGLLDDEHRVLERLRQDAQDLDGALVVLAREKEALDAETAAQEQELVNKKQAQHRLACRNAAKKVDALLAKLGPAFKEYQDLLRDSRASERNVWVYALRGAIGKHCPEFSDALGVLRVPPKHRRKLEDRYL